MTATATLMTAAFLTTSSLVLLVFLLTTGRKNRLDSRLYDLSAGGNAPPEPSAMAQITRSALPKMGAALMPDNPEQRTRLQTRLIHAGLYKRQAMVLFLGIKMLLMISPAFIGLAAGVVGLVSITNGVIFGAPLGIIIGVIGPRVWLGRRKATRQTRFRRALPDALDVLVVCLEGGLSLPGAFRRVASELRTAHPLLASELNIVQREMQLGRSTGEALRQFADRADLEELRSLGLVIIQAERFGASLVKALRVHADTLRHKRVQYAEEMGQKAAIKILFPTLVCIFPGIFIVILGPAVFRLMESLHTVTAH